jgi:hypothetical protein
MAQIHEAIAAIMGEVGSIKKDRTNSGQGYKFRGIDDVYLAVHDLFVKHGVFSVPTVEDERTEDRTTAKGAALIYRVLKIRYDFFARDGSSLSATVIGEGMDSGDKASNKAMSVAHKYAILQLLAIPTEDTIDPEQDSHDIAPKPKTINTPSADDTGATGSLDWAGYLRLVESAIPESDRVEWKRKANGGRDSALLDSLAVEIKARYAGKAV